MALSFYWIAGSPFAWRVALTLEHKGLPYESKLVEFSKGEHLTPEYLAISPRNKVPAVTDDGFSLFESSAIVEYLEEKYPDAARVFPADTQRRAVVRRMVLEADSYLWPEGNWYLAQELFFKGDDKDRDQDKIQAGRKQVLSEIERWEKTIEGDYLAGELSAADFALYPYTAQFARFELRRPDLEITSSMGPKMAAWQKRIEALPYFDKTYPPHWR